MSHRAVLARFRRDSVSWSVWPRLAISVPVVAFGVLVIRNFVITAFAMEPEAALLLFILGFYLIYAIPLLRVLWAPSASWRNEQLRAQAESRRIEDRIRYERDGRAPRIPEYGENPASRPTAD